MIKNIRTERMFCTDLTFLSENDEIVSKQPKTIRVGEVDIHGWDVELKISDSEDYVAVHYTPDTDE